MGESMTLALVASGSAIIECWVLITDNRRRHLTAALVDAALGRVVSMQHVGYLQRWLLLTRAQKQTL
jgi:hypothetical protein